MKRAINGSVSFINAENFAFPNRVAHYSMPSHMLELCETKSRPSSALSDCPQSTIIGPFEERTRVRFLVNVERWNVERWNQNTIIQ